MAGGSWVPQFTPPASRASDAGPPAKVPRKGPGPNDERHPPVHGSAAAAMANGGVKDTLCKYLFTGVCHLGDSCRALHRVAGQRSGARSVQKPPVAASDAGAKVPAGMMTQVRPAGLVTHQRPAGGLGVEVPFPVPVPTWHSTPEYSPPTGWNPAVQVPGAWPAVPPTVPTPPRPSAAPAMNTHGVSVRSFVPPVLSQGGAGKDASKHKTQMCRFFLEGKCLKGSACVYAHGKHEVRDPDVAKAASSKVPTPPAASSKVPIPPAASSKVPVPPAASSKVPIPPVAPQPQRTLPAQPVAKAAAAVAAARIAPRVAVQRASVPAAAKAAAAAAARAAANAAVVAQVSRRPKPVLPRPLFAGARGGSAEKVGHAAAPSGGKKVSVPRPPRPPPQPPRPTRPPVEEEEEHTDELLENTDLLEESLEDDPVSSPELYLQSDLEEASDGEEMQREPEVEDDIDEAELEREAREWERQQEEEAALRKRKRETLRQEEQQELQEPEDLEEAEELEEPAEPETLEQFEETAGLEDLEEQEQSALAESQAADDSEEQSALAESQAADDSEEQSALAESQAADDSEEQSALAESQAADDSEEEVEVELEDADNTVAAVPEEAKKALQMAPKARGSIGIPPPPPPVLPRRALRAAGPQPLAAGARGVRVPGRPVATSATQLQGVRVPGRPVVTSAAQLQGVMQRPPRQLCWQFAQDGSCNDGERCLFAHSTVELNRPRVPHPAKLSVVKWPKAKVPGGAIVPKQPLNKQMQQQAQDAAAAGPASGHADFPARRRRPRGRGGRGPASATVKEASKFKTVMCRHVAMGKVCDKGEACTYAHGVDELRGM
eukprot:TRINITY_DN15622_c0_g1_i1.p1 TRINITY_DN15622_c0_g1~~TRINITY_DN15622_c0_g1_i1.p1  ORF type:complete len:937 (+),score=209.89 TRINITY_DN15622_c0_g1_i1:308-2812(+)